MIQPNITICVVRFYAMFVLSFAQLQQHQPGELQCRNLRQSNPSSRRLPWGMSFARTPRCLFLRLAEQPAPQLNSNGLPSHHEQTCMIPRATFVRCKAIERKLLVHLHHQPWTQTVDLEIAIKLLPSQFFFAYPEASLGSGLPTFETSPFLETSLSPGKSWPPTCHGWPWRGSMQPRSRNTNLSNELGARSGLNPTYRNSNFVLFKARKNGWWPSSWCLWVLLK